jgi:hypothetical protein
MSDGATAEWRVVIVKAAFLLLAKHFAVRSKAVSI